MNPKDTLIYVDRDQNLGPLWLSALSVAITGELTKKTIQVDSISAAR